jgi:hypothetical protein
VEPSQAIDIGSRLELLIDDYLIAAMQGDVSLVLHRPVPRGEALVTDRPWEGNMCGYITVFQDGERSRMYYKCYSARLVDSQDGQRVDVEGSLRIAYTESQDGIHWERPDLGLIPFHSSTENNLVWAGSGPESRGVHGFAPFKDGNPDAAPDSRYKAVGAEHRATRGAGLYAMQSADGIHWRVMSETPVIRSGTFDSQNLAFWDGHRGEYRAYVRDFRGGIGGGQRDIRTATSKDFLEWTAPEWLVYPGAPDEQLYTNQIIPYYRAPHILVGFPTRYVERPWSPTIEALPESTHRRARARTHERFGAALTDGLFMSSRDGRTFHRWPEAFLRPGLRYEGNWAYGDNYQCWGLLETASDLPGAPPELSMYATEGYWRGHATVFRRYTLRLDGFVSAHASMGGGALLSKPIRFRGHRLLLNLATSAAGSVRVEMQTADGVPVEGYALGQCYEIVGDAIERAVAWEGGTDVSTLEGVPVRLRITLKDADLYALRFAP